MKRKILTLFLSFSVFLTSFNYIFSDSDFRSYSNIRPLSLPGVVVAPEIIATIGTIAVGCGIVLTSDDDIYDVARLVYDNYSDSKDNIENIFKTSVSIASNGVVNVGKEFLDICKSAFDTVFPSSDTINSGDYDISNITFVGGAPYIKDALDKNVGLYGSLLTIPIEDSFTFMGYRFEFLSRSTVNSSSYNKYNIYYPNGDVYKSGYSLNVNDSSTVHYKYCIDGNSNYKIVRGIRYSNGSIGFSSFLSLPYVNTLNDEYTLPYKPGSYVWDNISSNLNDDGSVGLYVPGDASHLIGQVGGSTLENLGSPSYDLPSNGTVVLPGVDSPSLDFGGNIVIPGDSIVSPDVPGVGSPSVPNEGIWATIKDFIIGLVVPSDTYFTDTWGGLYNNFTNSFPMVDMDGFNDLVTGEKKFPNIDINIMGVTGRVVNGDVINSIVDWLRPIVAGFMMLCLMLFNYRKIYKLIRNSEPFGGIASGTSDFSTGISEYSKQDVVKATDMVAEYRAWRERGVK